MRCTARIPSLLAWSPSPRGRYMFLIDQGQHFWCMGFGTSQEEPVGLTRFFPAGFFNFSPFQNYSHKHSSGSITQLFKLPHGTILVSISEKEREIDKNLPLIEVVTASHKNSGGRPERCQFALSKVTTARCDRNTFVHTSGNNRQHPSIHAHNRNLHNLYLVVSIFPFSTNGVRLKHGEETSHR